MMEPATSRATALVERTRRRAIRHSLLRALLRAVAAGLFLAAAATALARLAGIPPGSWLLAALLPVQVVAAIGAFRSRMTHRGAALLLDRETGSAERFTAVTLADDPEVRELAARQVLAVPAVRDGDVKVRYPPSREGLAVALGLFLLVLALILSGGAGRAGDPREDAGLPPASMGAGSGAFTGGSGDGGAAEPAEEAGAPFARAERRVDAGEDIPEDLWSDLETLGVDDRARAAVLDALARGDRAGALDALRAAAGGGAGRSATDADRAGTPPGRGVEHRWEGYEAALAAPRWDPRYDEIVRQYFTEAGR